MKMRGINETRCRQLLKLGKKKKKMRLLPQFCVYLKIFIIKTNYQVIMPNIAIHRNLLRKNKIELSNIKYLNKIIDPRIKPPQWFPEIKILFQPKYFVGSWFLAFCFCFCFKPTTAIR